MKSFFRMWLLKFNCGKRGEIETEIDPGKVFSGQREQPCSVLSLWQEESVLGIMWVRRVLQEKLRRTIVRQSDTPMWAFALSKVGSGSEQSSDIIWLTLKGHCDCSVETV